MVYVQDINGKPMMPTTRHGKVRRLLKDKKAVVVNLCPFTIKLMYVTSDYKQEIVLGVDAGTKHVGLSATGMGINVSIVKGSQKIRSLMSIILNPEKREVIPLLILLPYVKLVTKNTIKVI